MEFSQLVVDYQRKLRESSESLHAAEERSRKLTMEVKISSTSLLISPLIILISDLEIQ